MGDTSPSSSPVRDINKKREDFLEWPEYFMATAFLASKRSKDPVSQVGACIVNEENTIVAVGYNGMPKGCSDDEFPWSKNTNNDLENKHLYVCHAEVNAILNRNCVKLHKCTIYVGLFPCNECAKVIIQSGIKKVVYMSDKHAHKTHTVASKKLLDAANIECMQFIPKNRKIVIDFDEINWNTQNQVPNNSPFLEKVTRRISSSKKST